MPLRWKALVGPATMLVAAVVVAGCQEPKEIIPVAPPGLEFPRKPTVPQAVAVALGEVPGVEPRQAKVDANDKGSPPTPIGKPVTTASGLTYETLKEGTGAVAGRGQGISIHYTGTLENGTVFDSSRGKEPFSTAIGVGRVIPGWDEGVPGMKVGERRKLTIPANLGYGQEGSPPKIPGGATLIFDVELVGVN